MGPGVEGDLEFLVQVVDSGGVFTPEVDPEDSVRRQEAVTPVHDVFQIFGRYDCDLDFVTGTHCREKCRSNTLNSKWIGEQAVWAAEVNHVYQIL